MQDASLPEHDDRLHRTLREGSRNNRMIWVAGNLGSGKSTVASLLAAQLGWRKVPFSSYDATYVNDQWSGPERWTLEAQVSFLTQKINEISSSLENGFGVVVDRSPYEDIQIFARMWYERGFLDPRAYNTYINVAETLIQTIPSPGQIVYCEASWRVCEERISQRPPRQYQESYPRNYLEALDQKYAQWLRRVTNDAQVVRADTVGSNLHDPASAAALLTQILSDPLESADQLTLPLGGIYAGMSSGSSLASYSPNATGGPRVYIASGFTQHEEPVVQQASSTLALDIGLQGIPPGAYRSELTSVERALRRKQFVPLLPHRIVSRWGARVLPPRAVVEECLALVRSCDLFLGVLGVSFGAHAEAAYALGCRKPVVLVESNADESFFGEGMRRMGAVASMRLGTDQMLSRVVLTKQFDELVALAYERARNEIGRT